MSAFSPALPLVLHFDASTAARRSLEPASPAPDLTTPPPPLASGLADAQPAQPLAFDRYATSAATRRPSTFVRRGRITHLQTVAHPVPAPAEPLEPTLIVSRDDSTTQHGVCALCWSGPGPLAGSVCPRHAPGQFKGICSRCLVTLEMLAVQFDPQLRLHIETPA